MPGQAGRALAASLALAAATVCARPLAAMAEAAPAARPAGKPARPAGFDEVARKAAEAREAGRFEEAIAHYRKAVLLDPTWVDGRFSLATLLYDSDRYEDARDEFRRLAQAEPKSGLLRALQGMCEFRLRNYERALKELQEGRSLGITSAEVYWAASYDAATLLNRFEQYEAAFEILREFARSQKDTVPVIEAFGLSVLRMPYLPSEAPADRREMILMAGRAGYHQARGRTTTFGRQAFEELVSRYPAAPNVHYAYGVHLVSDEPERALEAFRRELRSSPNHYHAMLQIAYELIKQGRYEEARPHAEKGTELAPNLFAAHNALGRILLETGEAERAIQVLETAKRLAADSPEVRFSLARAYAKAGRDEDAAQERAAFLKLDKERRTARSGPQAVGGTQAQPQEEPPPQE